MIASPFGDAQDAPPLTPEGIGREKRITNGTKFLQDPRVSQTTLSRRVVFLQSKGLSPEEISECFQRINQPQSIEAIVRLLETAPPPAPPSSAAAPGQPQGAAPGPARYLPYPQAPLPEVPTNSWKDVLTRAGMLAVGAYAAFHAFQTYSPYEIRRRGEGTADAAATTQLLGLNGRRRSRFNEEVASPSQRTVAVPPIPVAPTATPSTTAGEGAAATSDNPATAALQEKITTLETDLATANAKYDKEKKERSELAFMQSRLKSQLQQLIRSNEKSAAEVTRLTMELQNCRSSSNGEGQPAEGGVAAPQLPLEIGAVEGGPMPVADGDAPVAVPEVVHAAAPVEGAEQVPA